MKPLSSSFSTRSGRARAAWSVGPLVLALLAPHLTGCSAPAAPQGTVSRTLPGRIATTRTVAKTSSERAAVPSIPAAVAATARSVRNAPTGRGAAPRLRSRPALHGERVGNQTRALAYRLVPGERRVYALEYASISASDFRALLSQASSAPATAGADATGLVRSFQTGVRGELVLTVLEREADRMLLACRLRQPAVRLVANGQPATAEAAAVQAALGRDFFLVVDRRGRVLSLRFDPSLKTLSQGFLRTLVAETQFVLPGVAGSAPRGWTTREDDPNGTYVARYERVPESGAARLLTFRKSKTRFLPTRQHAHAREREVPMTLQPQGSRLARFDAKNGRLDSVSGTESQRMSVQGRQVARSAATVRLQYRSTETCGGEELATLRKAGTARAIVATAAPLSAAVSEKAGETALQRNELGTDTITTLLARLQQAEGQRLEHQEETRLYLKFKALIFLRPEACPRLGQIVATAAPKSGTMRILAPALGNVGHPAAQAALATAVRARLHDGPALAALLPALSAADTPTPGTEAALREVALRSGDPESAATAQLVLGIVAQKLADTAPRRAAGIVDGICRQLQARSSEDVRRLLLMALGNAGSSRALPTLERALQSASPSMRTAAAAGLRRIPGVRPEALLLNALTADRDLGVRLEAAGALGPRPMTPASLRAHRRAFRREKAVNVRLAILTNLWSAREAHPDVRVLVKAAAVKDPAKEVRAEAARLIASDATTQTAE